MSKIFYLFCLGEPPSLYELAPSGSDSVYQEASFTPFSKRYKIESSGSFSKLIYVHLEGNAYETEDTTSHLM